MNIISKKIKAFKLNRMQKNVTKEYEENGLTDEVLDKQLEINMLRNKYDIPDKSKAVYKNYVQ